MSISSIAAQLYTIQAKKNIPLKTAFSMLVREDLAMRFSVYNLTKIITKSEFLASVAQTAFGERTPLQKKQDEEESRKEKADGRFKQFTVQSIVNLNRTVALLKTITARNSELINNLYSELGSYRGQRRIDPRSFTASATRVPVMTKSVKGKLEQINKEIEQLKKMPTKVAPKRKGTTAAKKEKEKDQSSFINSFLPLLLKYPRLALMLGGGAATAIGLGSFAAQAYSLYNLPGAFGRVAGRFGGRPGFEDPMSEQVSQFVDPAVVGIGTYTVGRMATAAAMYRRGPTAKTWQEAREGLKARRAIERAERKFAAGGGVRTPEEIAKERKAGVRARQIARNTLQARKFGQVSGVLRGIGKRLPALAAADVAITVSRMSGFVANHTSGKMSQGEYKQNMVEGYADLISTVGIGGASTILGSLVGTALFPGVGTLGGAITGGAFGYVASLFLEESESMQALATKMFEMIHEDNTYKIRQDVAGVKTVEPPPKVSRPPTTPSTPILASLLERGESKAFGGYTAYNQKVGNQYKAGRADLDKLSINDILAAQSRGQYYAVGKYQLIPSTLKEAKERLGLTGNEKFTPQIQEYIFANYLIGDKRPAIRDYLNGSSDNLEAALLALAQEWASVSTEYDQMKSYYAKDKASISKREAANALRYERQRRLALKSRGVDVSVIPAPVPQVPVISTTQNATVTAPPREEMTSASDVQEASNVEDAQVNSQAALQVSAAVNQKVETTQQQINNHDSRLSIVENLTRQRIGRNDSFEGVYV
jgi:muramidase (phage lysozyme)